MNSIKICVIGLGYVGLPLARLFSTKYFTVGFDMNRKRVDEVSSWQQRVYFVAGGMPDGMYILCVYTYRTHEESDCRGNALTDLSNSERYKRESIEYHCDGNGRAP